MTYIDSFLTSLGGAMALTVEDEVNGKQPLMPDGPVAAVKTSLESAPLQRTAVSNEPSAETEQIAVSAGSPQTYRTWSSVILGVWSIGVFANLVWLVCCAARAKRLVGPASADTDTKLTQLLTEVTDRMSCRRPIRIDVSPHATFDHWHRHAWQMAAKRLKPTQHGSFKRAKESRNALDIENMNQPVLP